MASSVRPSAPKLWENFVSVHPSTLQLFGCYVVERRSAKGLSQDVLAAKIGRSSEWVVSVERGELLPTTTSLLKLDAEIGKSKDENLPRILNELNLLPWGTESERLRKKYSLPSPPTSEVDEPLGHSAMPLAHEVEAEQRLLTVTPLLIGSAVLGLLITFGVLQTQSAAWTPPETPRSLGIAALVLAVAGALAYPISVLWRYVLAPLRSLGNHANQALIKKIRNAEKTPIPQSLAWVAPAELPYLTPYFRTRARVYAIRAEMAERLASIALAAAVLTRLAWTRAADSELPDVDPMGWKWLCFGSVGLFLLFHVRSVLAGGRLANALKLGFGRVDL